MFLSRKHVTLRSMPKAQPFDEVMVEVMAVTLRERLGFEPWELFAARARAWLRACNHEDLDRRTGRSTRDAVRALARCVVLNIRTIHVVGDRCDFDRVSGLVAQLQLPTHVVRCRCFNGHWGLSPDILVYQDHHVRR